MGNYDRRSPLKEILFSYVHETNDTNKLLIMQHLLSMILRNESATKNKNLTRHDFS